MYRLGDHEFEQVPCAFKLSKKILTYCSRWRWLPLLSYHHLSICDWLVLNRLLANQLDGGHDPREPRTLFLKA
jgi:hypothetical protein